MSRKAAERLAVRRREKIAPVVRWATERLAAESGDAPPWVIAISLPCAHPLAAGALTEVAVRADHWSEVTSEQARSLVAILGGHFALEAMDDEGLGAYVAWWMDCPPSEVRVRLWPDYRDTYLLPDEVDVADSVVQHLLGADGDGYLASLTRLLAAVIGRTPDTAQGLMWRDVLLHYGRLLPEFLPQVRPRLEPYEHLRSARVDPAPTPPPKRP